MGKIEKSKCETENHNENIHDQLMENIEKSKL